MKNRVKVLRAENDWSQARLAQELGVSRQTINAIETGKYDPGLPLAFNIARLFAKRIDEIFFPDSPTAKPAAPSAPPAAGQPTTELDISLI